MIPSDVLGGDELANCKTGEPGFSRKREKGKHQRLLAFADFHREGETSCLDEVVDGIRLHPMDLGGPHSISFVLSGLLLLPSFIKYSLCLNNFPYFTPRGAIALLHLYVLYSTISYFSKCST